MMPPGDSISPQNTPHGTDLRKYLSHKLGDYLATLETIQSVVDDDEATAIDLEYSRELFWDADHCLRGVLWLQEAFPGQKCSKDEAADTLSAMRTLAWLCRRHNEHVDNLDDERRGDAASKYEVVPDRMPE